MMALTSAEYINTQYAGISAHFGFMWSFLLYSKGQKNVLFLLRWYDPFGEPAEQVIRNAKIVLKHLANASGKLHNNADPNRVL